MKNTILYLIGLPGSGKYTIAREIQRIDPDFRLVDNHLILNPLFSVIELDGKTPIAAGVWDNARKIRAAVLDTIQNYSNPTASFIFTNYLSDDDVDYQLYSEIRELAQVRKARLIPVRIQIEKQEHERRITQPNRTERFKETDPLAPERYVREHVPIRIDSPYLLDIDVTQLSVTEAATQIIKHMLKL